MNEQHRENLSQYRLETSKEHLSASKLLLESGFLKDSIGRSYYAMFSAARAILALDGIDFSKHAGVISYFQKEYVKTEIFEVKYSKYLMNAFQIRNHADYADYYVVSKEDALEQYQNAEEFCNAVKSYIDGKNI